MNTMPTSDAPRDNSVDLSIVIPAFNESGNLDEIANRLKGILSPLGLSWEIIFSDDGSTDETWKEIQQLNKTDSHIKGVRLSRNFGHQFALFAGLQQAQGKAIISMDADLQHPPELIPDMVKEWKKGSKIVKTKRLEADNTPPFKLYTSRLFYKVFSYLSGVDLENGMADFRLLDRQVLNEVLQFGEEGLFLRGIVQWIGFSSSTLTFKCADRFSGTTKYTFIKMLRFAWHGVSSFSIVPLRIVVMLGFSASFISFLGILYAILAKLIDGHTVPGWASSIAIFSLLFGMLFISLGILSEYIGRIVVQVRMRPRFLVEETLGFSTSNPSPKVTDC